MCIEHLQSTRHLTEVLKMNCHDIISQVGETRLTQETVSSSHTLSDGAWI